MNRTKLTLLALAGSVSLAVGACGTQSQNVTPQETTSSATSTPSPTPTATCKPLNTKSTLPALSPALQALADKWSPQNLRMMSIEQREKAFKVTMADTKKVDPTSPEKAWVQIMGVIQSAFYNAGTTLEDYKDWDANKGGLKFEDAMFEQYAMPLNSGLFGMDGPGASGMGLKSPREVAMDEFRASEDAKTYKEVMKRAYFVNVGLVANTPCVQGPYRVDVRLGPESGVLQKILPGNQVNQFSFKYVANVQEPAYMADNWAAKAAQYQGEKPLLLLNVTVLPAQSVMMLESDEDKVWEAHLTSPQ